jgi:hypothetical protein
VVRFSAKLGGSTNVKRLDKSGRFELAPFPFAFEPTNIDDVKALFEQHERDDDDAEGNASRHGRRWVMVVLAVAAVVGLALAVLWLLGPIWAAGGTGTLIVVGFAVAGAANEAVATLPTRRHGVKYLLVPGGLVEQRKRSLRNQGALVLYSRQDSNLIVLHSGNQILVTRPDGEPNIVHCNAQEQLAVLNAWFSPASTPTVGQLSDLVSESSMPARAQRVHQAGLRVASAK